MINFDFTDRFIGFLLFFSLILGILSQPFVGALTDKINKRKLIFILLIASKEFTDWQNVGECVGTGNDPTCGSGKQLQNRRCIDGFVEKCQDTDQTERRIPCSLPKCGK